MTLGKKGDMNKILQLDNKIKDKAWTQVWGQVWGQVGDQVGGLVRRQVNTWLEGETKN